MAEHIIERAVRGHHIYKRIWEPVIGQRLQVRKQEGNEKDNYAVAILNGEEIVGHIPQEILVFLRTWRGNNM